MKEKRILRHFSIIIIVTFLLSGILLAEGPQVMKPKSKVKARQLPVKLRADVSVDFIEAYPCMACNEWDLARLDTIAPKNLMVYMMNKSAYRVNVKLTVKYFSLYRKEGDWNSFTRNIVIQPNSAKTEVFWANTYYDLVKKSKKIEATIEITNNNITDPNLSNNTLSTDKCEYTMI